MIFYRKSHLPLVISESAQYIFLLHVSLFRKVKLSVQFIFLMQRKVYNLNALSSVLIGWSVVDFKADCFTRDLGHEGLSNGS